MPIPSVIGGWIPDLPDHRDFRLTVGDPAALPAKACVEPRGKRHNQGAQGSCTGNAVAKACELQLRNAGLAASVGVSTAHATEVAVGGIAIELSRSAAYLHGREALGTVNQDSGAMIRDVAAGVRKYGLPSEASCPYNPAELLTIIPAGVAVEAARHKASRQERVEGSAGVKASIAAGIPVVIGFTVYANFPDGAGHTGVYPEPKGRVEGGHAVCVIGYDDTANVPFGPGAFIVENSWSADWGIPCPAFPSYGRGFFLMGYGVLDSPDLAADFWAVTIPAIPGGV